MTPLSRLGGSRGFRAGIQVLAVAALAAAVLVIVMIVLAGTGGERTFVVEARATGAAITFEGEHAWDLGPARVCEALPLHEVRPGVARGDRPCAPGRYREARALGGPIDWEPGGRALVEVRPSGDLEILAAGARGLPDGSRVLVPAEAWRGAGAQRFVGAMAVGDEAGLLLEGRYEARQAPSLLPGGRPDVVKGGPLLRGGDVAIVERGGDEGYAPAEVFGHLMAADPDRLGLHVVAVSRPGDTALEVVHPGAAGRLLIRPDIVDHALASPLLIALTVILTLVVGVMQLVLGTIDFLKEHPIPRAPAARDARSRPHPGE